MANTPQFGGTNGVPELNIGQAGSARLSSSLVRFRAHVLRQEPEVAEVVHGTPQQNAAFYDRLGWRGGMATWYGTVVIKNTDELHDLVSELHKFRTGSTIDQTSGVHSAPDKTYLQPTILKDVYGLALASKAILVGYRFGENFHVVSGVAGYVYGNSLEVVFRILG